MRARLKESIRRQKSCVQFGLAGRRIDVDLMGGPSKGGIVSGEDLQADRALDIRREAA